MLRICFQRCSNATLLTATKTYLKSRSIDGSKTSIGVKLWVSQLSRLLSLTSTHATLARRRTMRKRTLLLACNRSTDLPETWPMFQGVTLDVRATTFTQLYACQLSWKTEHPSSGHRHSSVSSWTQASKWTSLSSSRNFRQAFKIVNHLQASTPTKKGEAWSCHQRFKGKILGRYR